MSVSIKHFPQLARLLERGLSIKEARAKLVEGLICDGNLVRHYRLMTHYPKGRDQLRHVTLAYRQLGIEPPFAAIVDVKQLFNQSA